MRRTAMVLSFLLFFLAACFYRPVYVDPSTVGGSRSRMATPCREVSRSRCDATQCKAANMDYVTLHCSGTRTLNRCVANLRCSGGE